MIILHWCQKWDAPPYPCMGMDTAERSADSKERLIPEVQAVRMSLRPPPPLYRSDGPGVVADSFRDVCDTS